MFIECDEISRQPLNTMTFDEFVGAILSACRAEIGLSRKALAAVLDITPCEIKEIEAGTKRPSAALLIAMARHFDLSPSKLLSEYMDLFGVSKNAQAYGNVIFFARTS